MCITFRWFLSSLYCVTAPLLSQIHVNVDFLDLNNVCSKYEFLLSIIELLVDATTSHEALSFINGSLGYNQMRMELKNEELNAFCTLNAI